MVPPRVLQSKLDKVGGQVRPTIAAEEAYTEALLRDADQLSLCLLYTSDAADE